MEMKIKKFLTKGSGLNFTLHSVNQKLNKKKHAICFLFKNNI
jgi:hypothetical protein